MKYILVVRNAAGLFLGCRLEYFGLILGPWRLI